MEIVIAGAGAIGLLVGSFAAEAGMNVSYFVKRKEQAQTIANEGIRRISINKEVKNFTANASTHIEQMPKEALWVVAVKYAGVKHVLQQMQAAGVTGPVLFIQNGIGHLQIARQTDFLHIAFASVEQGAGRLDDRTVSHNGIGIIDIAVERGERNVYDCLNRLETDEFLFSFQPSAERLLLRKTLINCMINPLTAILQVKNGELVNNVQGVGLLKDLYKELISVFPEVKSVLSYNDVETVCRKTAANQSSMLADRLAGRPMEIQTIVSAAIAMAEKRRKQLPLLQTYEHMLKLLEKEMVR